MLAFESMRLTDEELLEKLQQEQAKLQAELDERKAKLNARTLGVSAPASQPAKGKQTRAERYSSGAMMLKVADEFPKSKEFMLRHLDEFLEHPRDRALFPELPAKPKSPKEGSE